MCISKLFSTVLITHRRTTKNITAGTYDTTLVWSHVKAAVGFLLVGFAIHFCIVSHFPRNDCTFSYQSIIVIVVVLVVIVVPKVV